MKASLIVFLVLTVVVLLVGKCTHSVYTGISEGFENFPDHAKKEVMYKTHHDLLKSIDDTVAKSGSFLSLAANLEKLQKPDGLIYFALEKNTPKSFDNTETIEIVKKFKGSNTSKMLINGTGYGQVDGKSMLVIEYPINKYDATNCVMYFVDEHKKK